VKGWRNRDRQVFDYAWYPSVCRSADMTAVHDNGVGLGRGPPSVPPILTVMDRTQCEAWWAIVHYSIIYILRPVPEDIRRLDSW
jgi:hypothetical protein